MRLVDAIGVVVVALLVVIGVVYLVRQLATGRVLSTARWEVRTRSLEGNRLAVCVERYGEPPQIVAELATAEPDFDSKLWEARSRAEQLAATLNASRSVER